GLPLDPVAQDGADRLLGELERVRVLRAGILSLPGCGISLVAGLDMDLLVAPLESDDHHAALGIGHCPETLAAEGTENSLNLSDGIRASGGLRVGQSSHVASSLGTASARARSPRRCADC